MISRRTLLGIFVGSPLGCMVTHGDSNPTRVIDVANLMLDRAVKQLRQEGFTYPLLSEAKMTPLSLSISVPVRNLEGPIDLVMGRNFLGMSTVLSCHLEEVWSNKTASTCKVLASFELPGHITFEVRVLKFKDKDSQPERFYSRSKLIHSENPKNFI